MSNSRRDLESSLEETHRAMDHLMRFIEDISVRLFGNGHAGNLSKDERREFAKAEHALEMAKGYLMLPPEDERKYHP